MVFFFDTKEEEALVSLGTIGVLRVLGCSFRFNKVVGGITVEYIDRSAVPGVPVVFKPFTASVETVSVCEWSTMLIRSRMTLNDRLRSV